MESDDWIDHYAHRTVSIEHTDAGEVHFRYNSPKPVLDLERVPDGIRLIVEITFQRARQIELRNARPDHSVVIRTVCPVQVVGAPIGVVEFHLLSVRTNYPSTFTGDADRLIVTSGTVTLNAANVREVQLAGGKVAGDTSQVGTLVLSGDCVLPDSATHVRLDPDGATISVAGRSTIERLDLPGLSSKDVTLRVQGPDRGQGMLAVEAVRGSGTVVLEKSELSVAGNDGALVIEGNGGLRIPPNRTVTDVALKDGAFLQVGRGSALVRFSGRLRVGDCRYATVIAPPGGSYEYAGLHKAGRSQPLGPEALTGATLRGVLINDDATGRQYLQELREAAVVEPNVDGLRVRKAAWRLPFARRRLTRTTSMMRAVDDASFFAQELAGLVDNKCGAGSIRTKANWAAYRGRHLTAQSGWERFSLGLFRLVGYSQRPGPPASLWLVLALLLTLPSLALTGQLPDGPISSTVLTAEAFEQFVSLLLSPLFLLRLAGDPQLAVVTDISTLILLLVRATVAAPFVFFVVAMARFLRAEWPW